MPEPTLVQTRRALHAVAELVLAGPQYRTSGDIRLAVVPGGFATVADPVLRVAGTTVVGTKTCPIAGTARELGTALGIAAGAPEGVYGEGSGVGLDDDLVLDADAARRILDAFAVGDAALRLLAPDDVPVLWPEHFDVGVRVDDVNYGVSPGDNYLAEPYAYVGVEPVPASEFWNAPFGVARPMTEFATVAELVTFFGDARARRFA